MHAIAPRGGGEPICHHAQSSGSTSSGRRTRSCPRRETLCYFGCVNVSNVVGVNFAIAVNAATIDSHANALAVQYLASRSTRTRRAADVRLWRVRRRSSRHSHQGNQSNQTTRAGPDMNQATEHGIDAADGGGHITTQNDSPRWRRAPDLEVLGPAQDSGAGTAPA